MAACAATEPGDDVAGCASVEPGSGSNIAGGGGSAAEAAAGVWMIGSMSVMLAVLFGVPRARPAPVHCTSGVERSAAGIYWLTLKPVYGRTAYSLANVSGRVATARATGPKRLPLP